MYHNVELSQAALAAKNSQFRSFSAAFLTETDLHSEIAATHSKQTTASFLTETRIAHFASRTLSRDARNSAFLPGSGKYVECDVTHSKQSTEQFLPGARTHISESDRRNSLIRFLRSTTTILVSRRLGSIRVTDWKDRVPLWVRWGMRIAKRGRRAARIYMWQAVPEKDYENRAMGTGNTAGFAARRRDGAAAIDATSDTAGAGGPGSRSCPAGTRAEKRSG
jgi:hypothetical protein